jgi:FKBP-type peptidyl-prolyl cis-trans isomerase SlyD
MESTRSAFYFLIISLLLTTSVSTAFANHNPKEDQEMTISSGKTVSIEYTLTLGDDKVIDTNVGGNPLTFVQGNQQIINGLEKELEGLKAGDTKKVTVTPEEGYGKVIPEAVVNAPVSQIPEEARTVGAQVQGKGPEGQVLRGEVTEVGEETATIDFNHPLAGKTLHFDVKILSVEDQ